MHEETTRGSLRGKSTRVMALSYFSCLTSSNPNCFTVDSPFSMRAEVTRHMSRRTLTTVIRTAFAGALFLGMCVGPLVGQVPNPQSGSHQVAGPPKAVSLAHLYWHFLIYQHHLDQLASQHEAQGKDGRWLRSYLQNRVSMTDEDFAPIRESADRLNAAMETFKAHAKSVVIQVNPVRGKDGTLSPEGRQSRKELKQLSSQREEIINAEIKTLNAALTPEARASLQKYLTNIFSSNVRIVYPKPDEVLPNPFHPTPATNQASPVAPTGKVQP
jgi:hypothetical protein